VGKTPASLPKLSLDLGCLIPYDLKLLPAFHLAWESLMSLARRSVLMEFLRWGTLYFIIVFNSQKTGKFTKEFFNCR
jgi:hypothetical protein